MKNILLALVLLIATITHSNAQELKVIDGGMRTLKDTNWTQVVNANTKTPYTLLNSSYCFNFYQATIMQISRWHNNSYWLMLSKKLSIDFIDFFPHGNIWNINAHLDNLVF